MDCDKEYCYTNGKFDANLIPKQNLNNIDIMLLCMSDDARQMNRRRTKSLKELSKYLHEKEEAQV